MDVKQHSPWFTVEDEGKIDSPALLVYPGRIAQNIREMLAIAGNPDRLRPHVKTHKMVEIIRMQQDVGIRKFKCATLAEAELLAQCAAEDVLGRLSPNRARACQALPVTKKVSGHAVFMSCR